MKILLVDADACSDLAREQIFIDLVKFKEIIAPDHAFFVSVFPYWSKPAKRLISAMSPHYQCIYECYTNKKGFREALRDAVNSNVMLKLLGFLPQGKGIEDIELTVLSNNATYAMVLHSYVLHGERCNWHTFLDPNTLSLGLASDRMCFKPLCDVPTRQPKVTGPREYRE